MLWKSNVSKIQQRISNVKSLCVYPLYPECSSSVRWQSLSIMSSSCANVPEKQHFFNEISEINKSSKSIQAGLMLCSRTSQFFNQKRKEYVYPI